MAALRMLDELRNADGSVDTERFTQVLADRGFDMWGNDEDRQPEPDHALACRGWMRSCSVPARYLKADPDQITQCDDYRVYVDGAQRNWREGLGLILFGPTGTGKSMAMAHALKCCWSWENAPTALWVTQTDLVEAMKPGGDDDLVAKAKSVRVLALDDFGVSRLTDFVLEQFEAIAERRHAAERCLLMTTNLTPKALAEDASLSRIWRRWSQDCMKGIMRVKHGAARTAA